jgi:hypothetical protein
MSITSFEELKTLIENEKHSITSEHSQKSSCLNTIKQRSASTHEVNG